jgi:hypothetical protein
MLLLLALGSVVPSAVLAESAPRYKKNTVVDFDGATVEGKSRKPYSAYVSDKAMATADDLAVWQPDFNRTLQQSRKQWEYHQ